MKKLIAMLLAAAMLVSMLCTGCGKPEAEKTVSPTDEPEEIEEPVDMNFTQLDEHYFDDYYQEDNSRAVGINLLLDGDFSGEMMKWALYTESGGLAEVSKQDGQCVIDVKDCGSVSHAVQIYYDGFKMYQYGEYELTFTASSTVEKVIQARIQLNGGDYRAYMMFSAIVNSTPQTFTVPFTMGYESDEAPRLCFNAGYALDETLPPEELGEFSVYIDDVSLVCTDASEVEAEEEEEDDTACIIVNQAGYAPDAEKRVVFRGFKYVDHFEVVDPDGNIVFSGVPTEPVPDENAWEYIWYGDFSDVKTPGIYMIKSGILGKSVPFTVGGGVYDQSFDEVVHMFYMQRCGMVLTHKLAGNFSHQECHNSKARIYGTDEFINVSGGWHDAGGYGRYMVPGAKAAADLLLAYEAAPSAFSDNANIPESGNGVPDILDEVRYELEWMFKMQDASSGGVHHKVTCANFPDNIMPEDEKTELIVCPINEMSTGDFAAVMAKASEIYAKYDSAFAEKCLNASLAAWGYLEKEIIGLGHYSVKGNPEGITTGEYIDEIVDDEICWAAAELFKVTGDAKYEKMLGKYLTDDCPMGFGWRDNGSYALQTYLSVDKSLCSEKIRADVENRFFAAAEEIVKSSAEDSYNISLGGSYPWGSNMNIANNAMLLLMANDLAPNADYIRFAQTHLDYLFGVNPVATCFITGCGTVSPTSTHHRPSLVKGETVPGMVVGGTNSFLEDAYAASVLNNTAPGKCYVDNFNSFSTNEVAIYWNSPVVYVMARLCEAN